MDKLFAGIAGALIVVAMLFFVVILGTLMGALCGWIVGLFFADTILSTLARMGVDTNGLLMSQLGATLGFIGGFFKASFRSGK